MREAFLHYVWKFQYFDKTALYSSCGQTIAIQHPGLHNFDAGPDFEQSKIQIGSLNWAGHVEIHYKSSDWEKHQHQKDAAYDNVILHVVWEDDQVIYRQDGSIIPALALKRRINPKLITQFNNLISSEEEIACSTSFQNIQPIIKYAMLDKALIGRLNRKADEVLQLLNINQQDWEETAYQLLAKNFGFKTNSFPFLLLARGLPFKTLRKHGDQLFQLEALLFGQSGLIAKVASPDDYHSQLSKEYHFLAHKYKLASHQLVASQWKFLRMRPANFPTIRLAQFAALHHQHRSFFSKLLTAQSLNELKSVFNIQQSKYWTDHYIFGKSSSKTLAGMGQKSVENLIINSVVPLLAAYGKYRSEQEYIEKAIALLQQLGAENNHITKVWESLKLPIKTAFDSQAAIEWYQEYCKPNRCLQCSVGVKLVR